MTLSLFDSFNARPIEPEIVGKNFICNSKFIKLTERNNSVLIGPRGSGKTTYFKMLTLPALYSWKGLQRNEIFENVDYRAIYVPTDFSWFPDFRHPVGLKLDPIIDDIVSYARFRNSVLRCMVSTIEFAMLEKVTLDGFLGKYGINIANSERVEFARRLASGWGLQPEYSGIRGIIESIDNRNREVQRLLAVAYTNPELVHKKIDEKLYLHDRIFDDLTAFANALEDIIGLGAKWAICFDEVEIAPLKIKKEIWRSLRSADQRFIIKLSASPFDESLWDENGPTTATANNDYKEIFLAMDRKEALSFSKKIFDGICAESKIPPEKGTKLLGPSYYDDNFDMDMVQGNYGSTEGKIKGNKRSHKTGFYVRKFRSLIEKDPSFRSYLKKIGVNIDEFGSMHGNRRAFVRKFISTVVIRDAYLRPGGANGKKALASKKAIDRFYTGMTTIFTICEGNPRWLLVVLRPMIESAIAEYGRNVSFIPREDQSRALEEAVTGLLCVLTAVAPKGGQNLASVTLLEIIERVGDFFVSEILGDNFLAEPRLSFTVDKDLDDKTLECLGIALNQGAFVIIPDKRNPKSVEIRDRRTLKGQRMRLSYYLAPRYRLPLIVGREVKLKEIIGAATKESASERQIILDLFGETL